MKRLWAWLLGCWAWLNETQPRYVPAPVGSRDRSLHGKARIRARRAAA